MKTEEYKKRYIKNYLDQESEIQRGINQLEIWNKYMSTILADKLKLEEYSRVIEDLTYIINAKKLERYAVRQLFEEEEIQSTMENIVRNWDQVRSTISKFFITKIYRESSMENTVQVIKNIIASEREMLKRMSAIG
ncbi:hypothetical protein RBG61_11720 [Paludicola sp. MB14-C6]|uniref:hypothetical protein n=1 Tax=Paludihabitans sp. MB14-C6 TaxID=3070656 RepID=UPI0027DE80DC|nr:hypothetical protein [Paludicola sp. MB14-C6]WMJ22650.1 hypothetical protein RBG61_11720 [Paludicola sp. MB14-C6]